MTDMPEDDGDPDICPICQKLFADGDAVVQVVEDRYPTYDREIVLHTYHRSCFSVSETVMHDCPGCACMFHLALIRQGRDYQNVAHRLFCPFCAKPFDCHMGSAGNAHSCVEGEEQFPAQEQAVGRVMNIAPASLKVDRDLLERQAGLLGRAVDGTPLTPADRKCLEGLWEFVHSVIDSMDG